MPSSARGWFCWSLSVSDRYTRPHGVRYEYDGYTDRRLSDKRETAISVVMMAERSSAKCSGNGAGLDLMRRFYAEECSWWSLSEPEQFTLRKTIRHFSRALRDAGFLAEEGGCE
jgi:hypothetical protein